MKMAESSKEGTETLWEKEKSLVASNFSFSHRVFQSLVYRQNQIHDLIYEIYHFIYASNFIHTEPQKKRRTKQYNSQFSLHLYNEIVDMCKDKILVQR